MNRSAILRCLLAAVLFGASTPAASLLAGDLAPMVLAGLLYLGAGIAVTPLVVRRPPSRSALLRSRRQLAGPSSPVARSRRSCWSPAWPAPRLRPRRCC